MKRKLTSIWKTDCYIEFDTNEQLRAFLRDNPSFDVITFGTVYDQATLIRFYSYTIPRLLLIGTTSNPTYHHSEIEP
jgi:hypothetical protein